jgi:PII-like signaling protein
VVVEVVEEEKRIQEILPDLEKIVDGGLITIQKVSVISCHGKMKQH